MGRSASDEGLGESGTSFGEPVEVASTNARTDAALQAGSVIDGKYRLDKILGEGGMGSVWQARNLQLDVDVAIKLLRAGPDIASLSERMKLEARSAARLVHPAIVRVFDIDTAANGDPFIVMELLNGESLADLMDRGRLSTIHAVQTLLPICEALALAHAKGIVHRDLKPQNVFMTEEGERLQPKLLDFGIAKLVDASLPAGSITDTGILLGSPDYMSPEQARGLTDLDHRTDIWSFCVVLYEAITGITPFQGVNYNALMRAIIDEPPLPIPSDLTVEPQLQEIILRGLSKERAERPSSIQALGRELAQWLKSRGINEDVAGGALDMKWTGRAPQRSVPVITDESASREPAPTDATLISASHSQPHGRANQASIFGLDPSQRRRWLGLTAGVVLAGSAAALATSAGSREARRAPSSPVEPRKAATQPAAPAALAPPLTTPSSVGEEAPVQLAVTPPSPSLNPIPSSPHATKRLPARPATSAAPSQSAAPKRESQSDDVELLQAY